MKKIILTTFILITMLISVNSVYAVCDPTKTICNPLRANSVQEVIYLAVDIAVYVGYAFAILSIIYVGFKFVAAQGNSDKITEARNWLGWIIVGLAILISANVIALIVKNTLVDSGVVDSKVFNNP